MAHAKDASLTCGIPSADAHGPFYQAYEVLHCGLLAPTIAKMLPFPGHAFIMIVGMIEVIPGIGAFLKAAHLWLRGFRVAGVHHHQSSGFRRIPRCCSAGFGTGTRCFRARQLNERSGSVQQA